MIAKLNSISSLKYRYDSKDAKIAVFFQKDQIHIFVEKSLV